MGCWRVQVRKRSNYILGNLSLYISAFCSTVNLKYLGEGDGKTSTSAYPENIFLNSFSTKRLVHRTCGWKFFKTASISSLLYSVICKFWSRLVPDFPVTDLKMSVIPIPA